MYLMVMVMVTLATGGRYISAMGKTNSKSSNASDPAETPDLSSSKSN